MIKVQNIYYMLAYAFRELWDKDFKRFETESFENQADLCAEILINAVCVIIKAGFKRGYIENSEFLNAPKGRMEISETISQLSFLKPEIFCTHDEYSENIFINKLIKSSLRYLLKQDIKKKRKQKIILLLRHFATVDDVDLRTINWNNNISNSELNDRLLLFICKLIYKHSIFKETDYSSKKKIKEIITDKDKDQIYEHFLLGYFKKEFRNVLKADAKYIDWMLDPDDENDDTSFLLPNMKSDILIRNPKNEKVLIIDAKYYSKHILQNNYGKDSVRSNNLYQIFTYTKNYALKYPNRKVSGMLLYAQTDNERDILPDNLKYSMSGNKIYVKTLDLNQDFSEIKNKLNSIASMIL